MPTNLAIDDALLERALRLGGKRTKRETVDEALREFIARRLRLRSLDAIGTIEFDEGHDYKRARKRR
jgi:Arc/MetJ family transcription regulator